MVSLLAVVMAGALSLPASGLARRHTKKTPASPTPTSAPTPSAAKEPASSGSHSGNAALASHVPVGSEADMLRRILLIEDQRIARDRTLAAGVGSNSSKVRRAALRAIGRIKDTSHFEAFLKILNQKKSDRTTKRDIAFALGLIGNDTALKILQQQTQMQTDNDVLAAMIFALGRGGGEGTVNSLSGYLREEQPAEVIEAAAHGIGLLWSGPSEKWTVPGDVLPRLAKLAGGPDPAARAAAFALSRFKGDSSFLPTPGILEAAGRATSPATRGLLARVLGKTKAPDTALFLAGEIAGNGSVAVRIEAAKALGNQPASETGAAALRKALDDANAHLQFEALETISVWGLNGGGGIVGKLAEPVEKLYRGAPSNWIKGAALRTLVALDPKIGRPRLQEVLTVPASPLLEAAVSALALSGAPEDLERLAAYVGHGDIRVAEAAIEGLSQVPEERVPATAKPALRKALEGGDTALTSLVAQLVERFKWKDFAPSLATVFPLLKAPDEIEAKVAVLNALALVGDHSHLDVINAAFSDPERLVVQAAANAKKAIAGVDESSRVPATSKGNAPVPSSWSEVRTAMDSRVSLRTNRGEINLKMTEEAPLTVWHFVRLVKQGFYNGKTFHRVVPNFVVQGGDPHGDGYGGPGYLIRDELSPQPHERGTVGIATAGPDTGGCQFFFNVAPNLHLDAKYTLFAEVTSGMDVVDQLEPGDRILTAKVVR